MSMATLEREILLELKEVSGNKKIKMKDVMEWATSEVKAQDGEKYYYLPKLGIHCAVKIEAPKEATP